MKTPKGARLLNESEVPRPGDFCRWSQSKRDEWREIPRGDTMRSGLPVATIRTRCGQSEMQFCTFSK
jgi:hypothetical protein